MWILAARHRQHLPAMDPSASSPSIHLSLDDSLLLWCILMRFSWFFCWKTCARLEIIPRHPRILNYIQDIIPLKRIQFYLSVLSRGKCYRHGWTCQGLWLCSPRPLPGPRQGGNEWPSIYTPKQWVYIVYFFGYVYIQQIYLTFYSDTDNNKIDFFSFLWKIDK